MWRTSLDSSSSNATAIRVPPARDHLSDHYDIVTARSMARALVLLREQDFSGVYVDGAQISAVRWAGVLIQADEILDAIADGVSVVDPDLGILWANPEFLSIADPAVDVIGSKFYRALGNPKSSVPTLVRSPRRLPRGPRRAPSCGSARTAICG